MVRVEIVNDGGIRFMTTQDIVYIYANIVNRNVSVDNVCRNVVELVPFNDWEVSVRNKPINNIDLIESPARIITTPNVKCILRQQS